MDVRSRRFRNAYNGLHRASLAVVVTYLVFLVFSIERLATYAGGLVYLVLVPSLCYLYAHLSRVDADYAVSYSLVVLLLGSSSVLWAYQVSVASVSPVSTYVPSGLLCVGLGISLWNMYSQNAAQSAGR